MNIAEAGEGPLVLLCHGFPETSHAWRHQITALAGAGFHAVAPDMRGYGRTESPDEASAYTVVDLVADMVALVDALGAEQAVIVGNDWGATVAWQAALMRPDRFRGVVAMSVPLMMVSRSSSEKRIQPAISSVVRPHPAQRPVRGSREHMRIQGVRMSVIS